MLIIQPLFYLQAWNPIRDSISWFISRFCDQRWFTPNRLSCFARSAYVTLNPPSLHWLWNGGREAHQPAWHRSSPVEALYVLACSGFSSGLQLHLNGTTVTTKCWQDMQPNTAYRTCMLWSRLNCGWSEDFRQRSTTNTYSLEIMDPCRRFTWLNVCSGYDNGSDIE